MGGQAGYRSPLRRPPLPTAGQSIENRLWDTTRADMAAWCIGAGAAVLLAALEWLRFLHPSSPSPKALTVGALLIVGLAIFRVRSLRIEARRLSMARDGELIVAEMLQRLVAAGWRVFHDVPATGFNVDHVAIGASGVLAIETKTRRKPINRDASIRIDDTGIALGGQHIGWQPVEQADRQAAWLKTRLKEATGRTFAVRPVVLFPGWYIEDSRRPKEPWVLSCTELPSWVEREQRVLESEDIALASDYLDRYIRDSGPGSPS